MSNTTRFFDTCEDFIEKDEFLRVYHEVYNSAYLLCAPFGLFPKENNEGLDDEISAHYLKVFGEWEELVSRAVFEERGYTQDQMVASVNKYITGSAVDNSLQPDAEVMEEVQVMARTFPTTLSDPFPKIVQFDTDDQKRLNATKQVSYVPRQPELATSLDANLTAILLDSVIRAVSYCLYGDEDICLWTVGCSKRSTVENTLFEEVHLGIGDSNNSIGLKVPKRLFSPVQQLLPSYLQKNKERSREKTVNEKDQNEKETSSTDGSLHAFKFGSADNCWELLANCLSVCAKPDNEVGIVSHYNSLEHELHTRLL